MGKFVINYAQLKKIGGGSVKTFCERNKIGRTALYQVDGQKSFQNGSKAQAISEKLMELGVADWGEED